MTTTDNTPAMDAKTKELLEAKAAYVEAHRKCKPAKDEEKRLLAAIAAFEPAPVKVEPKRLYVNEGNLALTRVWGAYQSAGDALGYATTSTIQQAVPYIEITPDTCIVKAGSEFSEADMLELIFTYSDQNCGKNASQIARLRAVINAIRTQCGVKP